MSADFTHFADLAREIEPPRDGILSRTLLNTDQLKVVLFGFAENEELSDHTATMPAILHVLRGRAELRIAEQALQIQEGAWTHLPPNLTHAVRALAQTTLLLLLIKPSGSSG